jgi:hypothetical protein
MVPEKTYNFKIFVLGHDSFEINERPFLTKINLNEINTGIYSDNQLAESRIFFNDLPLQQNVDYLGFATYQWNDKFYNTCKLENMHLLEKHLDPNVVWCAYKSMAHWSITSEWDHAGMFSLLYELSDLTQLNLEKESFYCNCFICHKSVYLDFVKYFKEAFDYFYKKYKFNLPFIDQKPEHAPRHAAFFYERVTMLYFANRKDLCLKTIGTESDLLL